MTMYSEKLSQFVNANRPAPITLSIAELAEKLQKVEGIELIPEWELAQWGMYDVHGDTMHFIVQMDGKVKTSYIPAPPRKWWEKLGDAVFYGTEWTLPHERGEVIGLEPISSSLSVVRLADSYQDRWSVSIEDDYVVFTPSNWGWHQWLHKALGIMPVRVQLPEAVVTLPREPWREVEFDWEGGGYANRDDCLTCFASEIAETVTPFLDQLAELVEENPTPGYKAWWLRELPETSYLCPECQSVMTSGINTPDGDFDSWLVNPHCPECGWENGRDKTPYDGCLPA